MSPSRPLRLAAEIALAAVTLAAVVGMSRLFVGGQWMGPLLISAASAHVVVAAARRAGLSLPTAALLTTAGAAVVTTWTGYWTTTTLGLPTGDTWAAMRTDLAQAWTLYQDVVAPAPAEPGFVLASAAAVWFIAFIADWAAFRLWVPFEATLPAGTLFLFTALLGEPRGRSWSVALFAGTILSFLLLHRLARTDTASHWVADRRLQGNRWLLGAGALFGGIAVVAGTLLGPSVPGASSAGVIDPRGIGDGSPARVTISPLVDIRSRLVEQSAIEVFRVQSPQPAYWRLTSLERFDGSIWSSSGAYTRVDGRLPTDTEAEVATTTFLQTFEIGALAAIWLPAAYEPRALAADGVDVLWEERSATLIVDKGFETSDGLSYRVSSASPRLTAADLAGLGGPVPEEIAAGYTDLPDDFSPTVRELATSLTAATSSPYEAALALQDHLRTFTYDLQVGSGHSGDVLERFLLETRRGYCEQFAGAFAAMARSIGLPARVAVGFTFGEVDPTDPSRFIVRGEHAHAWPEVFLAGAGWVGFEPTPGRGMPFAEDYTGVPVAQAATDDPGSATTAPPTTDGGTIPTLPDEASRPFNRADELDTTGGSDAALDEPSDPLATRYVLRPLRRGAPAAAAIGLAYLVLVPAAVGMRVRTRRARAQTPAERIALAWAETEEEAELIGYRPVRSETLEERARRLADHLPDGDGDLEAHRRALTRQMEVAAYSLDGADGLAADLAEEARAALVTAARAAASPRARALRWFDLGTLIRRTRGERRAHRRITTTVRADLEAEHELTGSGDRR